MRQELPTPNESLLSATTQNVKTSKSGFMPKGERNEMEEAYGRGGAGGNQG